MRLYRSTTTVVLALTALICISAICNDTVQAKFKITEYTVNPKEGKLHFYLKNENGENYRSFKNVKEAIKSKGKKMIFAMNGGMFQENLSPLGLYIESGKLIKSANRVQEAYGNFYLQPNGVFFITQDNKAGICKTEDFRVTREIKYATQSGPMLLIDGKIHLGFGENSANKHIRNGVGILPDGSILFAISEELVRFYDFADFFRQRGCKNALYLDGFVSRIYLPSKGKTEVNEGDFGVIIAETN